MPYLAKHNLDFSEHKTSLVLPAPFAATPLQARVIAAAVSRLGKR